MKKLFIELDYSGEYSDLAACHELELLLEFTDFKIKRYNSVDTDNLFSMSIGNG